MLSTRRLVHVINLHRMGFVSGFDVQMRYARLHLEELAKKADVKGYNVILLAEHNPVYTVGIRDRNYTKAEECKLRETGAEFHRTNRGGLITYHGPGQLVAYPIINLKHFGLGMRGYVRNLEETMMQTCDYFGLKARTTHDTGVWIDDRKIGAIGIHGSRYVTTHGVSLNCNTDLSWYKHIVPCGIEGKDVTSISRELDKNITINNTTPFFLESFRQIFDCELEESFLLAKDMKILPTVENLEKVEKLHDMNAGRLGDMREQARATASVAE